MLSEELHRFASRVANLEADLAIQKAILNEHDEAAAIFQPGGRFHKRANLTLGESAVVGGMRWFEEELTRLSWFEDEVIRLKGRNQ